MTDVISPETQQAIDLLLKLAGGVRHVASVKGEQEFKLPIGSPIVDHPYEKVVKDAKAAAGATGTDTKGTPASAADLSKESASTVPLNLGGSVFHLPAGSKMYSFPHAMGAESTDRIVKTPSGQYFYVGVNGHAPLPTVTDETVASWIKDGQISDLGALHSAAGDGTYQGIKLQPGDHVHAQGDGGTVNVGVVHADGSATTHTKHSSGKYEAQHSSDAGAHGWDKNPKLGQHPQSAEEAAADEAAKHAGPTDEPPGKFSKHLSPHDLKKGDKFKSPALNSADHEEVTTVAKGAGPNEGHTKVFHKNSETGKSSSSTFGPTAAAVKVPEDHKGFTKEDIQTLDFKHPSQAGTLKKGDKFQGFHASGSKDFHTVTKVGPSSVKQGMVQVDSEHTKTGPTTQHFAPDTLVHSDTEHAPLPVPDEAAPEPASEAAQKLATMEAALKSATYNSHDAAGQEQRKIGPQVVSGYKVTLIETPEGKRWEIQKYGTVEDGGVGGPLETYKNLNDALSAIEGAAEPSADKKSVAPTKLVTADGSKLKVGDKPTTVAQLNQMLAGTVLTHQSPSVPTHTYSKNADGTWQYGETKGPGAALKASNFAASLKLGVLTVSALPVDSGEADQLRAATKALASAPHTGQEPPSSEDVIAALPAGSEFTTSDGKVLTKAVDGFWEGFQTGISSKALFALYGKAGHVSKTGVAPKLVSAEPTEPQLPSAFAPKLSFGGVTASAAELQSALDILAKSKGMMIKGPLEKEGHPLAATDYHAIVAAYKQTHPDFQPQTKFAAKEAFLEALQAQIDSIASAKPDDAAVGIDQGDGTHEFGGVKVTPEQLATAHAVLSESKGMMIKGPLDKIGNPLAHSDYHSVVAAHKAATSFKAEGKFAAKEAFVAALHKKLDDLGYWKSLNPPSAQDAQAKVDLSDELKTKTYTWGGTEHSVNVPSGSDVHESVQVPMVHLAVKSGTVTHAWNSTLTDPVATDDQALISVWQKDYDQGKTQLISGHSVIEPHGMNPGTYKKDSGGTTVLVINPNGTGYLADQFGPLNPESPYHPASWVEKQLQTYTKFVPESDKVAGAAAPLPTDGETARIVKMTSDKLPAGSYYQPGGALKFVLHEDGSSVWQKSDGSGNTIAHDAPHTGDLLLGQAASSLDGNGSNVYYDPGLTTAYLFGSTSPVAYLKQLQMDLHDPDAHLASLTKQDVLDGKLADNYDVSVHKPTFAANMPDGTGWQQHAKVALANMFGQPGGDKDSSDPAALRVNSALPGTTITSKEQMIGLPAGTTVHLKNDPDGFYWAKQSDGSWLNSATGSKTTEDGLSYAIEHGTLETGEPQQPTLAQATAAFSAEDGATIGSSAHMDALPIGTKVKLGKTDAGLTYTKQTQGWVPDGHDPSVHFPSSAFAGQYSQAKIVSAGPQSSEKTGKVSSMYDLIGAPAGTTVSWKSQQGVIEQWTKEAAHGDWLDLDKEEHSAHDVWSTWGIAVAGLHFGSTGTSPEEVKPSELSYYHGVALLPGDKVWKQSAGAYTNDLVIQHKDGAVVYYNGGDQGSPENGGKHLQDALAAPNEYWSVAHTAGDPEPNATGLTEYAGLKLQPGDVVYHSEAKGWTALSSAALGTIGVYYPQNGGDLKLWKVFKDGEFTQLKPEHKVGEYSGPISTEAVHQTSATHPAPTHAVITPSPLSYDGKPPYSTVSEINALAYSVLSGTKVPINKKAQALAEASGYKGIAAQYLSKMSKSEVQQWISAWLSNDFGKAYEIEKSAAAKNGNADIKTPHKHPGNVPSPKVLFGPSVPGEIPAGVYVADPSGTIHSSTGVAGNSIPGEAADAYLLAAHMQNPQGLNAAQKKAWAFQHSHKNKLATDKLSLGAQANVAIGNLLSEPISPQVPLHAAGDPISFLNPDWKFDPSAERAEGLDAGATAAYLAQLFTGQTLSWALGAPQPSQQTIAQLHWLSTDANDGSGTSRAEATATFTAMRAHMVAQAAHAAQDAPDPVTHFQQSIPLEGKTYVPVDPEDGDPELDGAGEKTFVKEKFDPTGTKYLFKIAQHYSQNRPYVEDAAHQAATLFGYSPAGSAPAYVDLYKDSPRFGQIQTLVAHSQQVKGIKPEDLTDTQLFDILREHVLDWVLDNDDTHHGNLLMKLDGHVAGIDKGRSWGGDSLKFGQYQLEPKALGNSLSHNAHLYYEDVYHAIADGRITPDRAIKAYSAVMSKARVIEKASDEKYKSILDYAFERRYELDGKEIKSPVATTLPELKDAIVERKNNVVADFDGLWTKLFVKAGIEKPEHKQLLAPGVHTSVTGEFLDSAHKGGFAGHSLMLSSQDIQDSHIHTKFLTNPDGSESLMGVGRLRAGGDDKMMSWIKSNAAPALFGSYSAVNTVPKLNPADGSIGNDAAYGALLTGIKTINKHSNDGEYNESSVSAAQAVADKLQAQLDFYTANKTGAANDWYDGDLARTAAHADMAEKYLAVWKTATAAQQYKEKGPKGFEPYVYTPAPKTVAEAASSQYKIEKVDSSAPSGQMNYETGQFDADGESFSTNQDGTEFKITLPSGATVHYRSHTDTDTLRAQKGQFRFVSHPDNNSAAFGELTQFLRTAGVEADDADETSLELHYWRHLYGIMDARKDRNSGKQAAVQNVVNEKGLDDPRVTYGTDRQAELSAWREAWSAYKGQALVDKWVESKGFLPRYERVAITDSENGHGQPYWMRFDYDPVQWRKDHPRPLATSFNGLQGGNLHGRKAANGDDISLSVIKSGGRQSGSWRINNFGFASSGSSTHSDQGTGGGSYMFSRQQTGAQYHMYMDPALMLRTSTFSFDSDKFGDKKQVAGHAFFDPEKALSYTSGGNETMIKSQASVLDTAMAVAFDSETARQTAVKYYADNGIAEIGGVPVEKVFILESQRTKALTDAKNRSFKDYEQQETL